MAFGFGFNKQKVLNSAEKCVQQGKLQNAITEYEKILKADPKDLTVLNTVGDLYSRLGESEKAVDYFKSVGDAYATQGFTVKAIAMYKKLSKLKPSLECVLRLAELYTQQGLFNDARAQYRQVAEEFLRAGELDQAVRIFQKILEMDPENVAMRTKLAEVYVRLGKKTEAWQIFSTAVETLRARGASGPAEEIVRRMLTLDPGNGQALLLSGQMAFESGDIASAIQHLEKVADLDSHVEGLRTLLQAYVQTGRLSEAGGLAAKLLSVHNDANAVLDFTDTLIASGHFEDALLEYQQYADRLLAANQERVVETLHTLIGHVRGNSAELEIVLALLNKAGETTHLTEVYELLAHASVQSGELEKARDYYLKLTQLEPQNQLHANNYKQVIARLGDSSSGSRITVEEGATLVDELEATAPFIDQRYSDEVALAVRAALTDAELFTSYNMPTKALGPLLAALPKARRDLRLNQRLAALYTRAGSFAEAAACCRTLEELYHEAGYPDEASRYGDLAEKYDERAPAHLTEPSEMSMPAVRPEPETSEFELQTEPDLEPTAIAHPTPNEAEVSAPAVGHAPGLFWHAPPSSAETASTTASAEPEFVEPELERAEIAEPKAEGEIDLSEEWDGALSEAPAAAQEETVETASEAESEVAESEEEPAAIEVSDEADAENIAEIVAEARFYLKHAMIDQARAAFDKLRQLKPDANTLSALEQEIAAVPAHSPPEVEPAEEAAVDAEISIDADEDQTEIGAESEPAEPVRAAASRGDAWAKFFSEPGTPQSEQRAAQTPAPAAPPAAASPSAPAPAAVRPSAAPWPQPQPAVAQAAAQSAHANPLGDFVADLESSLGDGFLTEPPPSHAGSPAQLSVSPKPAALTEHEMRAAAGATAAAASPAHVAVPASEYQPAVASAFTYQSRPLAPSDRAHSEASPIAGVDLSDMFGELRQELEEDVPASGEDSETHYNLGVAFREMGLLDEAIGELQKVCQAVDRGQPFPHLMQTYTWLAQCFLDKGIPEAAIRWYQRALQIPGLDAEASTALHYELAGSYEAAHNKPAALKHFLEVYGSNIDYRDVAERIKALKS
jgi:tetratricopeptide (TPR) repeat protein